MQITAPALLNYIEAHTKVFANASNFPVATDLLSATSEANNRNAKEQALVRHPQGPPALAKRGCGRGWEWGLVLCSQAPFVPPMPWFSAFSHVLCCAVLCCAVLCCAVLCCAVLCCAVLCCAVLCCVVLCCAVLCCAVLCCAVLLCARTRTN